MIKFTVLFLENDQTDNFWALHTLNKTYYEARTLDELFNAGEGVPSSQLTDALTAYIVEKVRQLVIDTRLLMNIRIMIVKYTPKYAYNHTIQDLAHNLNKITF